MSKFERIVRDPEICGGQPTIRGTRVLVLDILDWLKEGKLFDEILANFPSITREDIQEIISYAKEMIAGEVIIYGSKTSEISTGWKCTNKNKTGF
ncbi:MAG: DUF433 domain-containing protein [Candidatus Helarchaeota archaeon]